MALRRPTYFACLQAGAAAWSSCGREVTTQTVTASAMKATRGHPSHHASQAFHSPFHIPASFASRTHPVAAVLTPAVPVKSVFATGAP